MTASIGIDLSVQGDAASSAGGRRQLLYLSHRMNDASGVFLPPRIAEGRGVKDSESMGEGQIY